MEKFNVIIVSISNQHGENHENMFDSTLKRLLKIR